MPYRLVKGAFHLFYKSTRHVGSRPDGDSMWFKPNNQDHLQQIGDRRVKYNGGGLAQLRFEGIDALELHYRGANHQKVPQCITARDRLLESVGFTNVTYAPSSRDIDTSVRTAEPHPIEGYIVTRSVDPFGRPVSFVFVGTASESDGSDIWFTPELLAGSLNQQLIAEGHAYPAYYTGFPADLRNQLTAAATRAQTDKLGLWEVDVSLSGAKVCDASELGNYAIWPKLYRRLFSFFAAGHTKIADFEPWLRANRSKDDDLWLIRPAELGNLHDIVEVKGQRIRMTVRPEDLVIVPG